ncbi:hypothetical protein GCM10010411_14600 [Actinomadura fulvescens]|uniref:Uncharacterized protein n=1 Tax=Actinomadura fulvescens TaxID=46160 RepID=A0ABN3PH65_9ACTN
MSNTPTSGVTELSRIAARNPSPGESAPAYVSFRHLVDSDIRVVPLQSLMQSACTDCDDAITDSDGPGTGSDFFPDCHPVINDIRDLSDVEYGTIRREAPVTRY